MLSARGPTKASARAPLVSVDGSRPSSKASKPASDSSAASFKTSKTSKTSASKAARPQSARSTIVLHRHSHSRSPQVAKRVAPSVHVEAKLSALPSDSLAQALRDLQTMVQDWISKHYPNSLKQQRFERSDINVETANTPQWAAIFDLDETILHYSATRGIKSSVDTDCRVPREMYTFLNFLRSLNIKIVYITARREVMKDETQATLESLRMWRPDDILVLKPDSWPPESSSLYKHHARALVEQRGYSLILNVGDQYSDLLVWTKWRNFMDRVRNDLSERNELRRIAQRIRPSESGVNQLKSFAASISFPVIFFALEPNIPFALKLPQQEFFTK